MILGHSGTFDSLLLSSHRGGWEVSTPEGANPDELPYVEMTRRMVETFPKGGGEFQVEPDASSASYFHAVNALFPTLQPVNVIACQPPKADAGVTPLPKIAVEPLRAFVDYKAFERMMLSASPK